LLQTWQILEYMALYSKKIATYMQLLWWPGHSEISAMNQTMRHTVHSIFDYFVMWWVGDKRHNLLV
jgi:hypothetical protein